VSLVVPIVRTWLLHLRGRLHHLTAAVLCTSSSEAASLQKFHEHMVAMATVGQEDKSTG
jgi:hypothetical protein